MALSVCLLLDPHAEQVVRSLWRRIEAAGVPTLLSHTHGRHLPHLSLAVLRSWDRAAVADAVGALPPAPPTVLHLDALGLFRRSRSWLAPAVTSDLAARQERVVRAVRETGAVLHEHYEPGTWIPHVTLAPRTVLKRLPALAAAVYEVLPVIASAERAALVDSGTGQRWPLPHAP